MEIILIYVSLLKFPGFHRIMNQLSIILIPYS